MSNENQRVSKPRLIMNGVIKRHFVFYGVFAAIASVCSVALMAYQSWAKPAAVFKEPAFTFTAKANTTYTVLLGLLNSGTPAPKFDSVNVEIHWAQGEGKPTLELKRENGNAELGFSDRQFGTVDSVSIATFTPTLPGEIRVKVGGWSGPQSCYVLYQGLGTTVLLIVAIPPFSMIAAGLTVSWLSKRSSKRTLLGIGAASGLSQQPIHIR